VIHIRAEVVVNKQKHPRRKSADGGVSNRSAGDFPAYLLAGTHCLEKYLAHDYIKGVSVESPLLSLATYVFAMSIGDPGWGTATGFAAGLGAMVDGPPGLTIVGGIAGLTKRSEVRLLDGATMCPCFSKHSRKQIRIKQVPQKYQKEFSRNH